MWTRVGAYLRNRLGYYGPGTAKMAGRPYLQASLQDSATPDQTLHWTTVILVFSINGILSILLSRLLLGNLLHLDGNIWSGPWSYRIVYLMLIPPLYSVTLVAVGTLLGKHTYFKKRVMHMWGFLLRPLVRTLRP